MKNRKTVYILVIMIEEQAIISKVFSTRKKAFDAWYTMQASGTKAHIITEDIF
jgi:hypothetical protein